MCLTLTRPTRKAVSASALPSPESARARSMASSSAARPDDEGPGAPPDPPSLGCKMPGQRHHIAV